MVQSHIARNIRAELARRGKTQADLADVLGMQRQNISQRLLGRVDFRISELEAVADYLDIPLAELVEDRRASA